MTEDIEDDEGAFLSTQMVEDELVVDAVARGGFSIDADELVADHEAHLLGGAAVDDGLDDDGVISGAEETVSSAMSVFKRYRGRRVPLHGFNQIFVTVYGTIKLVYYLRKIFSRSL